MAQVDKIYTPIIYKPFDKTLNKFSKINQRIDSNQIKIFNRKRPSSNINYVMEVNWSLIRPSRGGVIVYTVINNVLYFGLGIDTDSGDLTDLGGGIRKKDKSSVDGSLREFMEESLCVFGIFNEEQVKRSLVIYSQSMMIIFLHLQFDLNTITNLFDERVKSSKKPEISGLVWLTQDELEIAIKTGCINGYFGCRKLYDRVKKLLYYAADFYKFL